LDILTLVFFNQHEVLTLNCAVTALDRWESYGMSLIGSSKALRKWEFSMLGDKHNLKICSLRDLHKVLGFSMTRLFSSLQTIVGGQLQSHHFAALNFFHFSFLHTHSTNTNSLKFFGTLSAETNLGPREGKEFNFPYHLWRHYLQGHCWHMRITFQTTMKG